MRPLPPTRPRPVSRALAALGFWLLVLPPVFFLAPALTVRADDTVRRAQEELRKRNLYFGDIDGTPNRGTVGALRRYQERKRLAVTGEVDLDTLHSLGIPDPRVAGPNAPLAPDPWPEMPVLRSDQARRPPPLAGEVIIAPEATPTPAPRNQWESSGGEADAPSPTAEASPVVVTPTPRAVVASEAPEGGGSLSSEAARAFIANYLRDGSANDLRVEMSYYAGEVDYFNKGPAGRDYIRRDVSNYYKRWPERRYELLGPVTAFPGARPGETLVRFQIRFHCRGVARAEGRTENLFTLQGTRPGEVRIIAMKEQRLR